MQAFLRLFGLSALAVVTACEAGGTPELLEYDPTAIPRVTAVETARLDGEAHGLVLISPLGGVALKRDGELVVAQTGNYQILFVSSDGKVSGAFGREGSGPGEFRRIITLGLHGDSVWIWDAPQGRATIIGPQHQYLATKLMPAFKLPNDMPTGPAAGALVGIPHDDELVGLNFAEGGISAFRGTWGGTVEHTLPQLTSREDGRWIRVNGGVFPGNPFETGPVFDFSEDGRLLAIAHPFFEGENAGKVSVTLIETTGDTVYAGLYRIPSTAIPQDTIDNVLAEKSARLSPELAAAFKQGAFIPPFWQPVSNLLIANDRRVWLKLPPDGAVQPYAILDGAGKFERAVDFPGGTTVAAAADTIAWAIETNELAVPSLVKYFVHPRQ